MLTASFYTSEQSSAWDNFVKKSRNATFLHLRDYMEYHRDRFTDGSLLLHDEKCRLVALLPANITGDKAVSHGGLTYGGLLLDSKADVMMVREAFRAIRKFYHGQGINELIYKPVPTIYDRLPSQEDRYVLFLEGATTSVVNISSAIDLSVENKYNENTRRNIRKAIKEGVVVEESTDLEYFYRILSELLASRFGTTPVHTLAELRHLTALFPENIRLMMAYRHGNPVAGALLYISETVTHTQYIAANDEGKACDALSLLFDMTIKSSRDNGKRYFDFGTCNENEGRYLNMGLIRQKNGFGGRGVIYPTYTLKI